MRKFPLLHQRTHVLFGTRTKWIITINCGNRNEEVYPWYVYVSYLYVLIGDVLHNSRKQLRCIFPFGNQLKINQAIKQCYPLIVLVLVKQMREDSHTHTTVLIVWHTHPNDPFHGLQFERLLVALQHLFEVFIPGDRNTVSLTMVNIREATAGWGDLTNLFQNLELDQRYCEISLSTTSV